MLVLALIQLSAGMIQMLCDSWSTAQCKYLLIFTPNSLQTGKHSRRQS
jgi:hypothetical protein